MGQLVSSTMKTLVHFVYNSKKCLPRTLLFTKLSEEGMTPTRGSDEAAGYDLYAAHDIEIPAQGKALVRTDVAIALPKGCYGRVAPRFVDILVSSR